MIKSIVFLIALLVLQFKSQSTLPTCGATKDGNNPGDNVDKCYVDTTTPTDKSVCCWVSVKESKGGIKKACYVIGNTPESITEAENNFKSESPNAEVGIKCQSSYLSLSLILIITLLF